MIWLDRIIIAGIVALVVFTPLAIGSVNPWSFCTAEVVIFLLTIVWMARLALEQSPRTFPGLRSLLIPVASFISLVLFQLLPLPPALMHTFSPSTYALYATSLPGWPDRNPYSEPPPNTRAHQDFHRLESAGTAVDKGLAPPERNRVAPASISNGGSGAISSWRPISIAPDLTKTVLLKLTAYACLFFLVLFYPFAKYPRPHGERRFCRQVLKAVLTMGLVVGCLGLAQQAFWNGKVLWFYVPYDWGRPRPDLIGREFGSFVNPDHFALYLNLILPLAVAGAVGQTFLSIYRWTVPESLRVFCLVTASVLTTAILLSLSRGGWIGGLFGGSIVIWWTLRSRRRAPDANQGLRARAVNGLYVVALLCILAGSALYTSPTAPTAVNARLEETLSEPDLGSRLIFWRDSLGLLRDFPVFGIGLGCFQDLFPRYQKPPWSPMSVREAHNDYLELVADAGIAGFAVAIWFCFAAGVRIYRNLTRLSSEALSVVVALLAGMAAVAFQEFLDFGLQITANALLFTVLLAIALRLCRPSRGDETGPIYGKRQVRRFAGAAGVAAMLLVAAALGQDMTPYPNIALPRDALAARALIFSHPARSMPHIWYATMKKGSAADRIAELKTAALLDPINPLILDLYAESLARDGQIDEAMAELKQSVFAYPSMSNHFYLQPDVLPWLSVKEREAIDSGFRIAIAQGLPGAVSAFASFCDGVHHDAAEADVLARASSVADEPAGQAQLLLDAGVAYARADERDRAAAAFNRAAELDPANPRPYEYLASQIFGADKDLPAARAAVQKGLANGADPFELYLSLAQTYEQAGDLDDAEASLLSAARLRPGGLDNFDTLRHIAEIELRGNHFDKAVFWLRKASELQPKSVDVLYQLALAEEAIYEYPEALRDLASALALAPGNVEIKHHYKDFEAKIAAYSDHNHRQRLPDLENAPKNLRLLLGLPGSG